MANNHQSLPPRPKSAPSRISIPLKHYSDIITCPQKSISRQPNSINTTSRPPNCHHHYHRSPFFKTELPSSIVNEPTPSSSTTRSPLFFTPCVTSFLHRRKNNNSPFSSSRRADLLASPSHKQILASATEQWLLTTKRFFKKHRYTLKEKRILRALFDRIDCDRSGEIDVDELADPLLSGGIVRTMAEVRNLVREVDTDDSGEIDFDEFLAIMRPGVATATAGAASGDNNGGVRGSAGGADDDTNPISKLERIQRENGGVDVKNVLMKKRRELLIDATMGEAKRREVMFDDVIASYAAGGGSGFHRGSLEVMGIQNFMARRKAEKEDFLMAIQRILEREIVRGWEKEREENLGMAVGNLFIERDRL